MITYYFFNKMSDQNFFKKSMLLYIYKRKEYFFRQFVTALAKLARKNRKI
jgi:hypothetical protein